MTKPFLKSIGHFFLIIEIKINLVMHKGIWFTVLYKMIFSNIEELSTIELYRQPGSLHSSRIGQNVRFHTPPDSNSTPR